MIWSKNQVVCVLFFQREKICRSISMCDQSTKEKWHRVWNYLDGVDVDLCRYFSAKLIDALMESYHPRLTGENERTFLFCFSL